MQDLSNAEYRLQLIDEILGTENVARKSEAYDRREIAKNRHAKYIEGRLQKEFPKTYQTMRKVLSINPTGRLLDERAALYKEKLERQITQADGSDLTEDQQLQVDNIYKFGKIDQKMKLANWIYELQDQCELQVIPLDGALTLRPLHPHQIDVVPDERIPEKPFAFISSTFQSNTLGRQGGDGIDEKIADRNDGQSAGQRKKMRFVMWSAEHNFLCDGNGEILLTPDDSGIDNPLGQLPFIDITFDRDSAEFWNRTGSPVCDFTVDLGVMLSDAAETGRLQNFGQGVLASHEKPESVEVGPQKIMWLQLDDGRTQQPTFEFVSPNGDPQASLDFIKAVLSFLQTAEGIDPRTITATGEGRSYKSGWDRMLAMVERFDESKDTMDIFADAEERVFRYLVSWSNLFQGTKTNNPLRDELRICTLPTDLKFSVNFYKPEVLQSKQEQEDSHIKLVEAGFESKVMAIMDLKGLDEDQAIEYCKTITEHNKEIGEPDPIDPAQALQVNGDEKTAQADQTAADKEAA